MEILIKFVAMNKSRNFSSKFKIKVVLESLSERFTLTELAQKHNLHPNQIGNWKREFLASADSIFEKGGSSKKKNSEKEREKLYKIIGQQKVEIYFLKNALSLEKANGSCEIWFVKTILT